MPYYVIVNNNNSMGFFFTSDMSKISKSSKWYDLSLKSTPP